MATTDRHGFLLWAAGFTQSDIILNDLLLKLETKLGLSVGDRDLNQPAGGESDGDCYIVGSSPTGAWSAFSQHDVVILRDSTWYAVTPIAGWPAWVEDENVGVMFNGTSWVIVSKDLPVDKLDATADPTVDNDTTEGYSVGSHWYNVTDDKAFVCLDATDGAAVWKQIDNEVGLVNNFTATTDPDADNDIDEGYTVGSRWVNTSSGSVFTCVDNTDGAAVWVSATGLNEAQVDARVDLYQPTPGTFSPGIQDDSRSDAESQTYNEQTGISRLTGDLCNFWLDLDILSLGTLTGGNQAVISGLPHTAAAGGAPYAVSVGFGNSLNLPAANMVSGIVVPGTSEIFLYKWSAVSGTTNLMIAEVSANARFIVSGAYPVAP